MSPLVLAKAVGLSVSLAARSTPVGSLAGMRALMHCEGAGIGESFAAHHTLVGLLAGMRS